MWEEWGNSKVGKTLVRLCEDLGLSVKLDMVAQSIIQALWQDGRPSQKTLLSSWAIYPDTER